MSEPDPDLSDFAREGCADAFRRLVERHVDAVHSTAARLLHNWSEDAADVTQGVFILLARKAPRLSRDIVVAAWLHRQTVRLALNARRADARRVARERTAVDLLAMNTDDPHSPAEALQPHVDEAIHALPASDQRIIALHYFDRCQQKEIATRMGLSPDAVQKRLSRALERVRRHLVRRGVAVPATALAAWFSASSVQAAPAELGASIAAQALPHAAAGTGFLAKLITIMTHTKALTAGAALGLATGGLSAAWPVRVVTAPAPLWSSEKANSSPLTPRRGNTSAHSPDPLAQPAPTAEGLAAQLVEFVRMPDTELNRQRMAVWMERIPAHMWSEFMALAPAALDERGRFCHLPTLARAWARMDPQAAIPSMAALRGFGSPTTASLAGDAFSEWHKIDSTAAQRWLVEHQDDSGLSKALPGFVSTVAAGLLEKSESGLLSWAAQLSGDDMRKAALKPLMTRISTTDRAEDWGRLCVTLLGDADEAFARLAIDEALDKWTRPDNYHPTKKTSIAQADQWLATLPPGSRTDIAAREILRQAVASSEKGAIPVQAVWRLASDAPSEARQLILSAKAIGPTAREWLLPLLTGNDRDALIMRAARQVIPGEAWASSKPRHGIAIQWAAEIADTALRDPIIYGLSRQWLQHQEEQSAHFRDIGMKASSEDYTAK